MKQAKAQVLKADPEKYPGLAKNPALERALRIQQAMEAGKAREEAVALAEQAMGKRAPIMGHAQAKAKPAGRPSEKRPMRKPTATRKAKTRGR